MGLSVAFIGDLNIYNSQNLVRGIVDEQHTTQSQNLRFIKGIELRKQRYFRNLRTT
ncbi:hypothetical protein CWATWH0005_3115 [Crocosphaera watsonii WH 0005]|uniref:Uncharacterized protein n=1 Tax=Crocosphaera watsonii WH 0005 TaxID=423472 RepID=T2ITK7_CROWT|nr:hypothetical protein CWATWH0005_3115 [Crocosphaera watsonii WH 0005]